MYLIFGVWVSAVMFAITGLGGCDCDGGITSKLDPKIQATPKVVIFETVEIGDKLTRSVVIKNIGLGELRITELKIVNESAGEPYSLLTKLDLPLVIEPDKTIALSVVYEPKLAGSAIGHILIISNAENTEADGSFKVSLRSSELAPDIAADPNPLDFGDVDPLTPAVKSLNILNRGQTALTLHGAQFLSNREAEFEIKTELTYPLEIAPGKSLSVDIKYSPKKPVADEVWEISNDSTGSPRYAVRLVGRIAAPDIEVEPTRLDFNSTMIGHKDVKTFEIRNKGTLQLEVSAVELDSSSSAEFELINLPSFPLIIEAGKSVSIEVQYHSQDTTDDAGFVKIASNDPDSPEVRVELVASARGCDLKAVPTALHFTQRDRKQLSIINQGNLPCTYKAASFSASTSKEFSFFLPPPVAQPIQPGQKLDFLIQFTPTDANDKQGELLIDSDDPDEPQIIVQLSSKLSSANPCELKVTPSIVQFGFVGTGNSRQLPLTFANEGFGDCIISQANISPNPDNAFALLETIPAQGRMIQSGSTIKMNVSFTPTKSSVYEGELQLHSNDTQNSITKIKLSGSSGVLCIEVMPDPLDFGSVKVGCSSAKQKLEIFNICNQTVDVTGVQFGANTNQKGRQFRIVSTGGMFPKTLKFSQSFTIELAYVPTDLAADIGTLEIANTAPNQSPILATLRGQGVDTDEQKDVFKQLQKPEIDILLVVDDSGSMSSSQANIANNFDSFIQWASTLQVDFHIGVTTTDTTVNKPPDIVKGCLRGNTKIITPQTPNMKSEFMKNVKVGTTGSATERGLEASYMALTTPELTGCNAGFYRQDAALSVIYVSDEPDQSLQTVNFYINFLINLKGPRNPDKIRASAIGPYTEADCQRRGDCRYYAVAQALRGVYDHIKTNNWANTLSNLGAITFGYRTQFFLSRPADPTSIQVKVNGVIVNNAPDKGWTFDASANSVNFGKQAVPPAGATIEITYKAFCLPPPP
jgi:hypothetical protein